jgi:hypothetical protein
MITVVPLRDSESDAGVVHRDTATDEHRSAGLAARGSVEQRGHSDHCRPVGGLGCAAVPHRAYSWFSNFGFHIKVCFTCTAFSYDFVETAVWRDFVETAVWREDQRHMSRMMAAASAAVAAARTMLHECHDGPLRGHFWRAKTGSLVSRLACWVGQDVDVAEKVQSCKACQRTKAELCG